jgi:hypothetical protein
MGFRRSLRKEGEVAATVRYMHSVGHKVEYALARIRQCAIEICIDEDCRAIGSTVTHLASPLKFWRIKRLMTGRSQINQNDDHKVVPSVHSPHGYPCLFYCLHIVLRQLDARYSFSVAAIAAPSNRVISVPAYDWTDRSVSSLQILSPLCTPSPRRCRQLCPCASSFASNLDFPLPEGFSRSLTCFRLPLHVAPPREPIHSSMHPGA